MHAAVLCWLTVPVLIAYEPVLYAELAFSIYPKIRVK